MHATAQSPGVTVARSATIVAKLATIATGLELCAANRLLTPTPPEPPSPPPEPAQARFHPRDSGWRPSLPASGIRTHRRQSNAPRSAIPRAFHQASDRPDRSRGPHRSARLTLPLHAHRGTAGRVSPDSPRDLSPSKNLATPLRAWLPASP